MLLHLVQGNSVSPSHWESRVERVEEGVRGNTRRLEMCQEEAGVMEEAMGSLREELRRVQEKQEKSEQAARKYFLLVTKQPKTRRLERPGHVMALVRKFLEEKLEVAGVEVEEASRVEGEVRPPPIRVKFASIKDRNSVLAAGRKFR